MKPMIGSRAELVAYLDGFFESGNAIPVERPWFNAASWQIAKECMAAGVPLQHDLIEREAVYRRKLEAYGDETRAVSPIPALHLHGKGTS